MAQGKFGGGLGTTAQPYLIEDAADLSAVRLRPSASYKLMSSINLGIFPYNTGAGWLPIKDFTGDFNGNGKKIFGLYINRPMQEYSGLFEVIRSVDGVTLSVYDLGIQDANITGKCAGAIAGCLNIEMTAGAAPTKFYFDRCYVTGKVAAQTYGGGLIGKIGWSGTLAFAPLLARDCFIDVAFQPVAASNYFGSIAGYLYNFKGNFTIDHIISVCTFSNVIAGVAVTTLAPLSFGTLYTQAWGTITACFYDITRWATGATLSTVGKTTDALKSIELSDFVEQYLADGITPVWSYQEKNRYPMLAGLFGDRYFVKTSGGYCVYAGGAWVIKYLTEPTREEALKDGMLDIDNLPYTAWDLLRATETTVDIIDILELSKGTTRQTVTLAMTLDTVNSTADVDKNYFRKTIAFADFGHSIATLNKGVVI